MASEPDRQFTGKHMAGILVAGFGIVATVNFYMAGLATGGFHGVVVENSYVASQHFNDWLEEAKAADALGWGAIATLDDAGHVIVATQDVPTGATVTADLRRPIGTREYASPTFVALGDGRFRSAEPVASGRWIIRLFIEAGGSSWAQETELR